MPPPSPEPTTARAPRVVLLGSVFVIAGCGLVYELIAGAVSSYLLGDPVTQFSLVIGVFLSAMGLGSFLAKNIRERLLERFVEIEILIGFIGGVSSLAMFAVNAFLEPWFGPFFYALCGLLGVLVGLEVPLLVRIIDAETGLSSALSQVLGIDYLGALAGALAFPFLALPALGLSRASVVFGLMNLGVAAIGVRFLERRSLGVVMRLALATLTLIVALVYSTQLVRFSEDVIYQDSVVLTKQSAFQRIVVTRWRDDVRLYLDGHLQFSSIDEARYHESLVIPAMEAHGAPRSVLILGGGDGLAAREVLKYASVERIRIVDLDPAVTNLARQRASFVALNQGSLESPRVELINDDAMRFLKVDKDFYDVVIADLPDPHSQTLAKLYSTAFYALVSHRLSLAGVFVTQGSSPYYGREAFWCIVRTLREALSDDAPSGPFKVWPYHENVPSFGEWGFVMASRVTLEPKRLRPSVATRYLTADTLQALFVFGQDVSEIDVEVNRLDEPVLYRYYAAGWRRFND